MVRIRYWKTKKSHRLWFQPNKNCGEESSILFHCRTLLQTYEDIILINRNWGFWNLYSWLLSRLAHQKTRENKTRLQLVISGSKIYVESIMNDFPAKRLGLTAVQLLLYIRLSSKSIFSHSAWCLTKYNH